MPVELHVHRLINTLHVLLSRSVIPHTPMGKKVLQCFPWYKRGKDRSKGRLCPPPAGKLPCLPKQTVLTFCY